MQRFEYRVVPAPARGEKAKGVKAPEDRFAHALAQAMNTMAAEGWEYQRAETLPCTEGGGFFSRASTTVYRSMLVFRRPLAAAQEAVVAPVAELAEPVAAPVAGPVVGAPQVARSDARADARPDPRPDPRVAIAAATAAQAQSQPRTQVQPQPRAEAPAQEPPVRRRLMAAFAAPEAPAAPPPASAAPSPVLRAEREEPARGGRRLNLATPMVPRSASTTAGTGPRPVLRFPGESRDGTQRGE